MSAWTWEQQSSAADWMLVPTGDAGLGLQVSVLLPALPAAVNGHLPATAHGP